MTNIENGQHIIIEGCYLPPEHIKDFGAEYLEQIIPLYIGFSKAYLEKNFNSGVIEHRSEIEHKDCDDYMNKDNFIRLHSKMKERCNQNNATYFEIDDHYVSEMANVYNWIDERVEGKLFRKK